MGQDRQKKHIQRDKLERKQNRREQYDRILIVCEDSKSAPQYFREICAAYKLATSNVEIQPGKFGTSPLQVVQYAQHLFENGDLHKGIKPYSFEQVFVVFDRDDHDSYQDALSLANSLNGQMSDNDDQPAAFQAIPSVPCFELWLLLHYEDVQAAIHRDKVIQKLEKYLPQYKKGNIGMFARTSPALQQATKFANRLMEKHSAANGFQPYTAIGNLVRLLITLRSNK